MAIITVTNTVDTDYGVRPVEGSLRAAIEQAQTGDIIKFSPELANQTIALERRYLIEKDLTIDASDAPGLTIDGQNEDILLQVDGDGRELALEGLTLVNGFHEHNGAALRVRSPNAQITVEDSTFSNHTALYGAAIWAKDESDVTVINSTFDGNVSTGQIDSTGGAISVFDGGSLTIQGSEFTNNEGFSGGAVSTIFADLLVEESTFTNNQSRGLSGAVHADGASIPSDPQYYKGNEPPDLEGGDIIIRNSYFEGNTARGHGGGVGIWGYDQDYVTIAGNQFIGNSVTENWNGVARGGGLRASGKTLDIEDNYFEGNRSAVEAGAVFYQGESETDITNTVFVNNQAEERGGAIVHFQWEGPGTEITNSVFRGNQAPEGGAIYKSKPTPLTIQGSEFENNSPNDFGGLEKNLVVEEAPAPVQETPQPAPQPAPQTPTTPGVIAEPVEEGADPSPLPEPVVNLKLDETTGIIAADSSPQGENNPGALVGDPQWTEGVNQGAITFDDPGDAIHLASSQDINLGIHDQRTVSLWLKADELLAPGGQKQMVYKEGGHVRGLNMYIDQGRLYVGGWNTPTSESGWQGTWLSTDQLVAGEWNHVALVLDGGDRTTDGAFRGYLNGEKFGEGAGSQLWDHAASIGLGSTNSGTLFHDGLTGSGHGLTVALDEMMIFNAALSDSQIQGLAA